MTTTPTIRPAEREDFDQWLPLWEGYNRFYGRFGETALPAPITAMTWERFFDAYEPVHALVAESGGRLVGLAHYIFQRNTIMIEPTCYMQDLFASEAARSQGVGRLLIEGVYRQAQQAGLGGVYWHTHESNAAARQLYDRVAANTGFLVYKHRF
jgi:GNAT superfamily N-acetyltransferase